MPSWFATRLRVGERVRVTGLHDDGQAYRWWSVLVREVSDSRAVVYRPLGEPVHDRGHLRMLETIWQHVLWPDRYYILTESYTASGEPTRLDLDIASPPRWTEDAIAYTDHELDVLKEPGGPTQVEDEDEFADAIVQYGYSQELQARCRSALDEAIQLAETWTWLGCPCIMEPDARNLG
jgi:Protein of unknown function (DUF402)